MLLTPGLSRSHTYLRIVVAAVVPQQYAGTSAPRPVDQQKHAILRSFDQKHAILRSFDHKPAPARTKDRHVHAITGACSAMHGVHVPGALHQRSEVVLVCPAAGCPPLPPFLEYDPTLRLDVVVGAPTQEAGRWEHSGQNLEQIPRGWLDWAGGRRECGLKCSLYSTYCGGKEESAPSTDRGKTRGGA